MQNSKDVVPPETSPRPLSFTCYEVFSPSVASPSAEWKKRKGSTTGPCGGVKRYKCTLYRISCVAIADWRWQRRAKPAASFREARPDLMVRRDRLAPTHCLQPATQRCLHHRWRCDWRARWRRRAVATCDLPAEGSWCAAWYTWLPECGSCLQLADRTFSCYNFAASALKAL